MGAYGAALYAQSRKREKSTILTEEQLAKFTHKISVVTCGLCSNHCRLTVNTFEGGRKYIGGNRCEKPITRKNAGESLNIYEYKLKLLRNTVPARDREERLESPWA